MRVILANRFFHPDESATSRMMSSLAFGLAARGIEVHAVAARQGHDGGGPFPRRERYRGVTIDRVPTARFGRGPLAGRAVDYATYHLAAAWRIRRLARAGDVVLVGTDPPLFSVSAAAALAGSGATLVNWMLDLFPEAAVELGLFAPDGRSARSLAWLRDWSLRRARLNVAPIARMAELLRARGVDPGHLAVMHQWSDGAEIRPVPRGSGGLRQDWGLGDRFVVGYSGNFGRVHEFGTILDAADALRNRPDIVFLFVGAGQRKAWIEAEVARRRLPNVVMRPLQPRDMLCESLGVPDVHLVSLLPALEPCSVPSKFYGILAAGRPTLFVGDQDGEVARIVARGGCGAAFTIGDWAGLASAVTGLAADLECRAAMGTRARQVFEAEFHEAVGLDAWQRLLSGLATPAPKAAASGQPSVRAASAP